MIFTLPTYLVKVPFTHEMQELWFMSHNIVYTKEVSVDDYNNKLYRTPGFSFNLENSQWAILEHRKLSEPVVCHNQLPRARWEATPYSIMDQQITDIFSDTTVDTVIMMLFSTQMDVKKVTQYLRSFDEDVDKVNINHQGCIQVYYHDSREPVCLSDYFVTMASERFKIYHYDIDDNVETGSWPLGINDSNLYG